MLSGYPGSFLEWDPRRKLSPNALRYAMNCLLLRASRMKLPIILLEATEKIVTGITFWYALRLSSSCYAKEIL